MQQRIVARPARRPRLTEPVDLRTPGGRLLPY